MHSVAEISGCKFGAPATSAALEGLSYPYIASNVVLVHVDHCACKPLLRRRENVFSLGVALTVLVGVGVGVSVFASALAAATSVAVALILAVDHVLPVLLVILAVYIFRHDGECVALFVSVGFSLRNSH